MENKRKNSGRKKSFIFYEDWKVAAAKLNPEERLLFFETLTDYAFTGKLPDNLPYTLQVMFSLVTPFIDSDREKWEDTRNARAEAGRRSGEARRANKAAVCSTERTDNVNADENENVNVNVNVNADESENASVTQVRVDYAAPAREEVEDYVRQMGYTFSADAFFDYYTARGWTAGRNRITDWRAAARSWQQREPEMNGLTLKNGGNYGTNSPRGKNANAFTDAADAMCSLASQERV